jgi:hypothetical protein
MLATGIVGIVAVALAVVPALVALRLFAFPAGGLGVALGCLGAAVTGVKLIAMAWAFWARLSAPRRAGTAVAYLE